MANGSGGYTEDDVKDWAKGQKGGAQGGGGGDSGGGGGGDKGGGGGGDQGGEEGADEGDEKKKPIEELLRDVAKDLKAAGEYTAPDDLDSSLASDIEDFGKRASELGIEAEDLADRYDEAKAESDDEGDGGGDGGGDGEGDGGDGGDGGE